MFETVELGVKVDRAAWKRESEKLRVALLEAQRRLAASDRSLVVLLSGVEGAGKPQAVNRLLEWMDARGIAVHQLEAPTDEERERPPLWRFWRRLPAAGRAAFFLGGWIAGPLQLRARGRLKRGAFDAALERIVQLEAMLVEERVVVVKLWLHLSHAAQKKRLRKLRKDPLTRFRVTKRDLKWLRRYDRLRAVAEETLRRTSTGKAPWVLVDAEDERHRDLAVGRALLEALGGAVREPPRPKDRRVQPKRAGAADAEPTLLSALDTSRRLSRKEYERRLPELESRLARGVRALRGERRTLIGVFEGPDAAGKGGAIRRISQSLDAGTWDHVSVSAPTDEERAHPYLWRFWRALPRWGKVTLYDRSWYGRVLVERVEGFAAPADWQRAYGEINAFEEQLVDAGALLVKFWLAISPEEQLRRFRERQRTPYKQYKITEEDWRNRAKWDSYAAAANEMFERTSTNLAPWVLVPADDKHFARVRVLEELVQALDRTS